MQRKKLRNEIMVTGDHGVARLVRDVMCKHKEAVQNSQQNVKQKHTLTSVCCK